MYKSGIRRYSGKFVCINTNDLAWLPWQLASFCEAPLAVMRAELGGMRLDPPLPEGAMQVPC